MAVIKRNICAILISTICILSSIISSSAVKFHSSPTYEAFKLGDKITVTYSLTDKAKLRLENLFNNTSEPMYETPNFESKFQNRWKATPGEESSSYTFTVDKSEKTDGMRINASIADGTSTDSVETGIAIYDSIPRITEYPKDFSPEEGENFRFSCEFSYWGSGHSQFQIFLNDKKIHYKFSKVIYIDGLITLKTNLSAAKEMNDNNIYCQMSLHRTDGKSSLNFKSQPIKFQVLYKVNDINITSEIGKTETELSCSAVGNPPPKYEWRKKSSDKILSTNAKMKVEKSTDEYECTAWNEIRGTKNKLTKSISLSANGASRTMKFDNSLFYLMFILLLIIVQV